MKLEKLAGATSEIWQVFIQDSSSTVGAGLAGLVFNTSSLTAYYHRDTDTTATAITLATMTVGTFTSSGFKEIDATNMPGWYQFCPPNAAIASGAKSCGFHLKGAANMAPLPIEVQLTAYNPDDGVRMGMTALPNAAAEAAGGLYTRGTGAGQINQDANGRVDTNTKTWNALTTVALPLIPTTAGRTLDVSTGGEAGIDWANVGSPTTALALTGTTIATTQKVDIETIKTNPVVNGGTITFPTTATLASTTNITAATGVDITKILGTSISAPATAGILDVNVKNIDNDAASASGTVTFPNATLASTTNITAGTITTVTNLTNAPTSGDFTATMKTSIGTAVAASAVASVTGNVGGNVVGSVGSVVGAVGSVTGAVGSVTGNVGGNVVGTVASVVGAVGSVTGNVGGNVVGSVASVTARVTANTDQLAGQTVTAAAGVTFPGSVASPTNITAGTITTVTNLTNAPTVGDFTAAMKASITAAVPTATANADALLDRADAVEVGLTPRQSLRLNSAAMAGILAGAATTTVTIRNAVADSKTRITATVDADGNRTAVSTDVT